MRLIQEKSKPVMIGIPRSDIKRHIIPFTPDPKPLTPMLLHDGLTVSANSILPVRLDRKQVMVDEGTNSHQNPKP